jgi:hypothetical protein
MSGCPSTGFIQSKSPGETRNGWLLRKPNAKNFG